MTSEYIHHQETDAATGVSLYIRQDPFPCDPRREFDQLCQMVCWHRKHALGDEHSWPDPDSFEREMKSVPHIRKPLYLYDHSGLTMSTRAFHCPWDSGQVGWICVLRSHVLEEFGGKRLTSATRAKVEALMDAEVSEYDSWLRGDVWTIDIKDADGEIIDSCGGYVGADYAVAEGADLLAHHVSEARDRLAAIMAAEIADQRPDLHPTHRS